MPSENYNIEDPAKQEQIRRGSHEYVPTAGRHGQYRPTPWIRGAANDYPKMMGKWPAPKMEDFKDKPAGQQLFAHATQAWDDAMTASIVKSKAEELQWLKANANG